MKYTIRLSFGRTIVYSFFIVAAVAMLGACGMPFDWRLDLPDDWNSHRDSDVQDVTADPSLPGGLDPEAPPQAQIIPISGDHFTLYWDESPEPVSEYRLYQRHHGGTEWTLLGTGLVLPQATITQTDLDFGRYEFAVSSVDMDGVESELHTSLDATADPGTGWCLDWTGA
jgi:hypothetical protein